MTKPERVTVDALAVGDLVMVAPDEFGWRLAKPGDGSFADGTPPFGRNSVRGEIERIRDMWNHRGSHLDISLPDGRMIEMSYRADGTAYRVTAEPYTDARPDVRDASATMVTWDTKVKHRGDGTRTACGKVGTLAQFRDSYRPTCTEAGCLDAWAS